MAATVFRKVMDRDVPGSAPENARFGAKLHDRAGTGPRKRSTARQDEKSGDVSERDASGLRENAGRRRAGATPPREASRTSGPDAVRRGGDRPDGRTGSAEAEFLDPSARLAAHNSLGRGKPQIPDGVARDVEDGDGWSRRQRHGLELRGGSRGCGRVETFVRGRPQAPVRLGQDVHPIARPGLPQTKHLERRRLRAGLREPDDPSAVRRHPQRPQRVLEDMVHHRIGKTVGG
jgi:hypothetical protein